MYLGGRGLGGGSTINGMIALRAPLEDYERWRRLGAASFSSEMARSLYRAIETDRDFGAAADHGSDGPVAVERTPVDEWGELDQCFYAAARALGYEANEDLNGRVCDGVGPMPFTRANGLRVSANHAYLDPARARLNLTVIGNALVDRVLWDRPASRAVGVQFRHDSALRELVGGQIVLAAGALGSAGVLLRSGVGPPDDLRALGIKVVNDLPVGVAVQDHPMLQVGLDVDDGENSDDLSRNFSSTALRYSSGLIDDGGSDMSIFPMRRSKMFGLEFPPSLTVFLWDPLSRGTVRLRSADPADPPDYTQRMFSDPHDLARMRDAVRRAGAILDRPEAGRFGRAERSVGVASLPLGDIDDDAKLDETIRQCAMTQAHVSCTAPMGVESSRAAVVDDGGRVFGVENVRVADLSICPRVVRGSPYMAAFLLAEHVASRMQTSS
jgi:choline dehydrogenase